MVIIFNHGLASPRRSGDQVRPSLIYLGSSQTRLKFSHIHDLTIYLLVAELLIMIVTLKNIDILRHTEIFEIMAP